jgi:hypothetical protein
VAKTARVVYRADSAVPSASFTAASVLIELGRQDAAAHHEALCGLFDRALRARAA